MTQATVKGALALVSQSWMGGLTLEPGKPGLNRDSASNQLMHAFIHSFAPRLFIEYVIN